MRKCAKIIFNSLCRKDTQSTATSILTRFCTNCNHWFHFFSAWLKSCGDSVKWRDFGFPIFITWREINVSSNCSISSIEVKTSSTTNYKLDILGAKKLVFFKWDGHCFMSNVKCNSPTHTIGHPINGLAARQSGIRYQVNFWSHLNPL